MSNQSNRRTSSNVQAAIWLIGIGILWWTDLWWPGILILVGVSMLTQVLGGSGNGSPQEVIPAVGTAPVTAPPEKVEDKSDTGKEDVWPDEQAETPAFIQKETSPVGKASLPEKCPVCGGPIAENTRSLVWLSDHTVRCPFCDTVITLY